MPACIWFEFGCDVATFLCLCCAKELRDTRKELLALCKHRMRSQDYGNADAFIILINRLKRANNVSKLPKEKKESGRFLNDCLTDVARMVEALEGRSGAASIIYSQFTGRAGSKLHEKLTKAFDDIINANRPAARRLSAAQLPFNRSSPQPFPSSPSASPSSFRQPPPRNNSRSSWFAAVRSRGPFNPEKDSCFKCGKIGHMSRNCAIKVEKD